MKIKELIALAMTLIITSYATAHASDKIIPNIKPDLSITQEQKWKFLSGKWFGSQTTKNGTIRQEIMERSPQGTYKITFRVFDKKGKY